MSAKTINAKLIDASAHRPYIAAHEQVLYDHRRRQAPPPSQYGTVARVRA